MTREEFALHMGYLAEQYPARKLSEAQASEWFRQFGKQTSRAFRSALERYCETAVTDRAPTPGQIHEMLDKLRTEHYEAYKPAVDVLQDAQRGCVTHEEHALLQQAHALLFEALRLRLTHVRREHCGVMDVDEWVQAGRPKTWSHLCDLLMAAYEEGILRDQQKRGALAVALRAWIASVQTIIDAARPKPVVEEKQETVTAYALPF